MERASAILATDRVSKCSRLSCIYITCRRLSSSSTIKTCFAVLIQPSVSELTFRVPCRLALNPVETLWLQCGCCFLDPRLASSLHCVSPQPMVRHHTSQPSTDACYQSHHLFGHL